MTPHAKKIATIEYHLTMNNVLAWLDLHDAMLKQQRYANTSSQSLREIVDSKYKAAKRRFKKDYESTWNFLRQAHPGLEGYSEFDRHEMESELVGPFREHSKKPAKLPQGNWLYKDSIYSISEPLPDEKSMLLVLEAYDSETKSVESERLYWEELKKKHLEGGGVEETHSRDRIPESVRTEVWRRDGGKCARCGSRERLEFDHIIPVSKGGGNTARNIELLCEKCNRSKGPRIQ